MFKINSVKGRWHSLEANERPGWGFLSWGQGTWPNPCWSFVQLGTTWWPMSAQTWSIDRDGLGCMVGLGLPEKWQQFLNSPGDWAPVWWCLWSEEGELGGTGNKETHSLSSHLWNWGLLPFPVLVSTFSLSLASLRRESGLTTTHVISEFLTSLFIANT